MAPLEVVIGKEEQHVLNNAFYYLHISLTIKATQNRGFFSFLIRWPTKYSLFHLNQNTSSLQILSRYQFFDRKFKTEDYEFQTYFKPAFSRANKLVRTDQSITAWIT